MSLTRQVALTVQLYVVGLSFSRDSASFMMAATLALYASTTRCVVPWLFEIQRHLPLDHQSHDRVGGQHKALGPAGLLAQLKLTFFDFAQ